MAFKDAVGFFPYALIILLLGGIFAWYAHGISSIFQLKAEGDLAMLELLKLKSEAKTVCLAAGFPELGQFDNDTATCVRTLNGTSDVQKIKLHPVLPSETCEAGELYFHVKKLNNGKTAYQIDNSPVWRNEPQ